MAKKIAYCADQIAKLQMQCAECVKYLDYQMIHAAMKFLNWTWATTPNGDGSWATPSPDQLEFAAEKLLNQARTRMIAQGLKDVFGGTGGLNYRIKWHKKDKVFTVDLYFALSEWSNGYE